MSLRQNLRIGLVRRGVPDYCWGEVGWAGACCAGGVGLGGLGTGFFLAAGFLGGSLSSTTIFLGG